MALPILDGNQSATTLSTILSGGEHTPAHTVVSLGSTAISNITSAVSGSVVSISNFPASQTIAGTVTVGSLPNGVDFGQQIAEGYDNYGGAPVQIIQTSITLPVSGAVTASVFNATISYVSAVLDGDGNTFGIDRDFPVSGTVTVGNSITVSNFPASQTVTGTVELGPTSLNALESITVTMGQVVVTGGLTDAQLRASAVTIGGTVTANGIAFNESEAIPDKAVWIGINNSGTLEGLGSANPLPISGTVTVSSLPASTVTISNFPATQVVSVSNLPASQTVAGTVTAQTDIDAISGQACVVGGFDSPAGVLRVGSYYPLPVSVSNGTVTANVEGIYEGESLGAKYLYAQGVWFNYGQNQQEIVSDTSPLPISGTVTVGAVPNGSLTTRFGTPTTASAAFATTAVTNASRKYLLIQNVTTGSNVITVGIGFTPTTTQGIQLVAGAGITFESSYIPTGAVYVLSSVTASNFTILEA